MELPDPREAREAVAQVERMQRRSEALAQEVHGWLDYLRSAREENEYVKGIIEIIREGR